MREVVRSVAEFRSLADGWNRLADGFRNPLLKHEWFDACVEAFCPEQELSMLAIRSAAGLTAVAPLVRVRRGGVRRLELLGTGTIGEASGFLYRDAAALRELVEHVVALGQPLELGRLADDSPAIRALRDACRGHAFLWVRRAPGSSWVPVEGAWDEYEARLSGGRRDKLRRARRLAEKSGDLRFEVVTPRPDELESLLEETFRVEGQSWKARNGSAIVSRPGLQRFYTHYARAAARLGTLRILFLRVGGAAIAVRLAVESEARLWGLKFGYDEAWARCSPGMLLTYETIRHAFERKLQGVEFLGESEPWNDVWTDRSHAHVVLKIYPRTLLGLRGLTVEGSRFALRKVLRGSRRFGPRAAGAR